MPCWMNVAPISDSTMSHRIELFVRAALFRFAVAEQNVRADVQLFAGDFAQRFLGNGFRAHFGQLAFVHVGMHLVQRFRGDQFEHRITEEFEAFVVLGPLMLV